MIYTNGDTSRYLIYLYISLTFIPSGDPSTRRGNRLYRAREV